MSTNDKKLPDKTVERLSKYRRALLLYLQSGRDYIFSHEIAALLHITSVQVRRDLMLIGYSGTLRKGYDVKMLIDRIGAVLDTEEGQCVAIIGMGNLGRAMIRYFSGKRTKLTIVAAFDVNSEKVGTEYYGVPCYHFDQMVQVIPAAKVDIAIITVPADVAITVAYTLAKAGVKGILNYTSKPLNIEKVYLEEYDMITSLEKVAYFTKNSNTNT